MGEQLEIVIVHHFGGTLQTIKREQLVALELGGLACAWKDTDGKIHRMVGIPLETVSVESRIIQPM